MIHHINIIHYMIFFQFSFRAMEQIKTDTLLNPHPVGGRLVVVNETKTQKTRSALALQDILNIHARSRDLGSREAASQRSNYNHLITDESVNWKAPPFYLTQLTTQSPLHSYTTKILVNFEFCHFIV